MIVTPHAGLCRPAGEIGYRPRFVRISSTGMGLYPPVVALPLCPSPSQSAVSQHGWGSTPCGDGGSSLRSRVFTAVEIRGNHELGMGPYLPRVRQKCPPLIGLYAPRTAPWSSNESAISQRKRGFLTVRGGLDPRKLRFHPRLVEVSEIWNGLWTGDGTLSS